MEVLIPAEVEREVLRKRMGQVQDQWPRLRSSSRVQTLEELTPTDSRSGVVATVARLRGTSAQLALSVSRDLGEAVVIGHAKVLADGGTRYSRHRRPEAAKPWQVVKGSPYSPLKTCWYRSATWPAGP